jgi:hypothetical protein
MSGTTKADAERLMLMLNELRLPATRAMWSTFAERADTEGTLSKCAYRARDS